MKLYMTPSSPYARKCRILIRELDLVRLIKEVAVDLSNKDDVHKFNPLGKIPALELDDGSVVVDSPVICEYLDDYGRGHFVPRPSIWGDTKGRWKILTLAALGDGLTDAAVALRLERTRKAERQSVNALAHHKGAIDATLDALERLAPHFADYPTIGEIAVGCALGYIDFRLDDLAWREGRPQLDAWEKKFAKYPSVKATKPAAA
jgi:glutathione S-transferase